MASKKTVNKSSKDKASKALATDRKVKNYQTKNSLATKYKGSFSTNPSYFGAVGEARNIAKQIITGPKKSTPVKRNSQRPSMKKK